LGKRGPAGESRRQDCRDQANEAAPDRLSIAHGSIPRTHNATITLGVRTNLAPRRTLCQGFWLFCALAPQNKIMLDESARKDRIDCRFAVAIASTCVIDANFGRL
jgi:hypothetical protein